MFLSRLSFCPIVIEPPVEADEAPENSKPAQHVATIRVTTKVNFLIIATPKKSIVRWEVEGGEGTRAL
jgi:hypothetical protein